MNICEYSIICWTSNYIFILKTTISIIKNGNKFINYGTFIMREKNNYE